MIKTRKVKDIKECAINRKLNFEYYEHCLEDQTLFKLTKINHLEKNKLDVDSLRGNHKESITSDKFILKPQQTFRSEKLNVFAEEVNKIATSANNNERIQSIDSIEIYAYETSKDLLCKKEVIK